MGIFDVIGNVLMGSENAYNQRLMQKQSHEYNKESMGLQYDYNEKAAENAQKRAEKMYRKFQSPEAMIRQLKEAGLSTSLMYSGMAGKGGMGVMGNGAQGGAGLASGTNSGQNPYSAMGIGNPVREMAEIGLLQAQARKLNTDADTEAGTNKRGAAEIDTIIQGIENLKTQNLNIESQTALNNAQERLVNMKTAGTELENQFSAETLQDRIKIYTENANQAAINTAIANEKLRSDKRANEIGDATKRITISQVIADYRLTMRNIAKINSEISLNEAQVAKLQQEVNVLVWEAVKKHWESVNQFLESDYHNDRMKATYTEIEAGLQRAGMMKEAMIWSAAIGAGKDVIRGAIQLAYPIKPVKGFGR